MHLMLNQHKMSTKENIIEAIGNGNATASEIADYIDKDRAHVARVLKNLNEDGILTRVKKGRTYHYDFLEKNDEDGLRIERGYDWEEWIPTHVPTYVPTNGEYDEIRAEVEYRRKANNPAHIRLTGPTGCGKTHLARALAQELDMPLFDVSVKWATDTTDLVGRFVILEGETKWINGPLTKAILASKEQPVVLLLDEINRARPETKSALYEALDDRAQITIDAVGGETVEGEAVNLIVVSTMNVGKGHHVEELDLAEQRRLGKKWSIDYLGLNYPERETQLLTDRTPINKEFASKIVEVANDIRELAKDTNEQLSRGVPTGLLIEMAAAAFKYAQAGIENPALRASKAAIVRPYYESGDRDVSGRDTVLSAFRSYFDDMPSEAVLDEEALQSWVNKKPDNSEQIEAESDGLGDLFT